MDLVGEYAKAVVEVAEELKCPCLNLFQSMQDDAIREQEQEQEQKQEQKTETNTETNTETETQPWGKYLSDGLHFSREGNLYVGQKLMETIDANFPDIMVHPDPVNLLTGGSGSRAGDALGNVSVDGEGRGVGPWHDEIDHRDVEKAFRDHEELQLKASASASELEAASASVSESAAPPSKKLKN